MKVYISAYLELAVLKPAVTAGDPLFPLTLPVLPCALRVPPLSEDCKGSNKPCIKLLELSFDLLLVAFFALWLAISLATPAKRKRGRMMHMIVI